MKPACSSSSRSRLWGPLGARLIAALVCLLAGCTVPSAPTPTAVPIPTATPGLAAEQALQEAFGTADLLMQRAAVLSAAGAFLRDSAIRTADDYTVSTLMTSAAFSSGRLTLSDPAFVRRAGNLAVVGLPQGLGLYLYDLGAPSDSPPLEISRWTVGLSVVDVIWQEDAIGVGYLTTGADGLMRTHFALANRTGGAWRLGWLSDEAPDWWFNATGGVLSVAPDLSRLTVTGEAPRTTEAFYERPGEPRRTFRVTWQRAAQGYVLSPAPAEFASWQAWLWQAAIPAPYATLVEFIEHLQTGDRDGAAALCADPALINTAISFGLQVPERRYQVIEAGAEQIVFRDLQGTFVASFSPPQDQGAVWLMISLAPYGAEGEGSQP